MTAINGIRERARVALLCLAVAAIASAFLAAPALAQEAQDYSAVTDQASTEISAAVPIALGVAGLFVGIMLAYKVLRRMVRA